jgi:ubiquinone/menaquinone biosynthesis C-methylase UbiE
VEARLQRRVQRYGWDLAAHDYERLWRAQLAPALRALLERAALQPGERVLDVACGTGMLTLAAAEAVGPRGRVSGVDLSAQMLEVARRRADGGKDERTNQRAAAKASFKRMDAEQLDLPDASVDVALCALGLMYVPDPAQAMHEMRRVLRPGGRLVLAVWGDRTQCGWSSVFPIVEAEVASEVCPLFFQLGQADNLARLCAVTEFEFIDTRRIAATLDYADADEACDAAFVGGPVALAWSRFDAAVRRRVRARYVDAIAAWRHGSGYRIPGEFVIVGATVPDAARDQPP